MTTYSEAEKRKIEELKEAGYDPVYVWAEGPNEEDSNHEHPFDTRLYILDGSIEIRVNGATRELKSGDEIEIPRDTMHYAKTGSSGCKYIVAEKH